MATIFFFWPNMLQCGTWSISIWK